MLRGRSPRCREGVRSSLPGVGDPGSRPTAGCASEQPGELAFRQRVAGLRAEPVRGYRRIIDGAGLGYRIITLLAGGDGRPPGDRIRGLARLAGRPALAPAVLLAVNGRGRGRTRHGPAERTFTRVLCRRPGSGSPGDADEPDQELI